MPLDAATREVNRENSARRDLVYMLTVPGVELSSLKVILIVLSSLSAMPAQAAINACRSDDGTTIYQDRPCPIRLASPSPSRSRHTMRAPAGIHSTWFERPTLTDVRASCNGVGCECGSVTRTYENGLPQAVADALYLDGAWHRLETERSAARANDGARATQAGTQAGTRVGTHTTRGSETLQEAVCDVLMSQRTLRQHAEPVLAALRKKSRAAEANGFDQPEHCDSGNALACEYLDAVALYRRVLLDLQTLRSPRDEPGTDTVPARTID